jgi:hypothetical protein
MTQITARWIRGVAVVLNALSLVRLLDQMVYLANRLTPLSPVQMLMLGLPALAHVVAIVAIVWATKTVQLQVPAPTSN